MSIQVKIQQGEGTGGSDLIYPCGNWEKADYFVKVWLSFQHLVTWDSGERGLNLLQMCLL